jgi:hypothetical protein
MYDFNGKKMDNKLKSRVVRRIRLDKQQVGAVKRLGIASLDRYTRLALYEKLERDFNVKLNPI